MAPPTRKTTALTIAGSDSAGDAGIQADLGVFTALGVHGISAITCVTAQNRERVSAIEACSPRIVREQIVAASRGHAPAAVKTGMLYSAAIIRSVAAALESLRRIPLVVDPVLISTSGVVLLQRSALPILKRSLFTKAVLITPNLSEASALTHKPVRSPEQMREAARRLFGDWGCGVLVKGGHLPNSKEAADILFDGRNEFLLTERFRPAKALHGTGCRLSAAIAGYLAQGHDLLDAVTIAKEFVVRWIDQEGH